MAHYIYSLFPSIATKHFLKCPSKLGRLYNNGTTRTFNSTLAPFVTRSQGKSRPITHHCVTPSISTCQRSYL